jgi:hypothetical protein
MLNAKILSARGSNLYELVLFRICRDLFDCELEFDLISLIWPFIIELMFCRLLLVNLIVVSSVSFEVELVKRDVALANVCCWSFVSGSSLPESFDSNF